MIRVIKYTPPRKKIELIIGDNITPLYINSNTSSWDRFFDFFDIEPKTTYECYVGKEFRLFVDLSNIVTISHPHDNESIYLSKVPFEI